MADVVNIADPDDIDYEILEQQRSLEQCKLALLTREKIRKEEEAKIKKSLLDKLARSSGTPMDVGLGLKIVPTGPSSSRKSSLLKDMKCAFSKDDTPISPLSVITVTDELSIGDDVSMLSLDSPCTDQKALVSFMGLENKRHGAILELIIQHSLCVSRLKVLEDFFFDKLPKLLLDVDKDEPKVSEHNLNQLQKNIRPMLALCQKLEDALMPWKSYILACADSRSDGVQEATLSLAQPSVSVAKVIVNSKAELSIFRDYLKNADETAALLRKLVKCCPHVKVLAGQILEKEKQSVQELTLTPFHLCSRCPLLLDTISHHYSEEFPDSWKGSTDSMDFLEAKNIMLALLKEINCLKEQQLSPLQLLETLRSIKNLPAELISSKRTLVKVIDFFQEKIIDGGGMSPMVMVLLNDAIVVTKAAKSGGSRYQYHFYIQDVASWCSNEDCKLSLKIDMDYLHSNAKEDNVNGSSVLVHATTLASSKMKLSMKKAKNSLVKNFSKMMLTTSLKSKAALMTASKIFGNSRCSVTPSDDHPGSTCSLSLTEEYVGHASHQGLDDSINGTMRVLRFVFSSREHRQEVLSLLEDCSVKLFG